MSVFQQADNTDNGSTQTNDQSAAYEQAQQALSQGGNNDDHDTDHGDAGDVDLFFGDEALPDSPSEENDLTADREDDTPTIKQMRQQLREYKQQLKDKGQPAAPAAVAPPVSAEFNEPKPQLQDEGIDFDPDKFAEAWESWNKRKAEHESSVKTHQEKAQQLQQTLIAKQQDYYKQKTEIVKRVPNYDAAERTVMQEIPEMLQATLLMHSENPTMTVLALGRNKKLRDQLIAAQTDPVALGRLIGTIDAKARLAPRKPSDLGDIPEVKGEGGGTVAGLEAQLERARQTNDYTKVIQLKNQIAKRKAAKDD